MLVEFDILVKQSGIYVRGFVLILHLVYLTGLNELGMFQFRVYVRGRAHVLNQLERSMLVGFVF
jgi:hypothetical protein